MIFSTIDRSFSHSSRARGVGIFGTVFEAPRMNNPSYSDGREKGFGFLRGYINLASNDFNFNLSDFKSIGAIPRLIRLFSNEAPGKELIMRTSTPRKRSKFQRETIQNRNPKAIRFITIS
ncbi:hypothetical protein OROGR_018038 [Orobanche gracilis]